MSKECLNGSEMSRVLKALDIANKRIDQLEKYNLDLANESHNKSMAIDRANERVQELESVVAAAIHAFDAYEMDVDTYPTIEHVMLKNNLQSHLNKFAIEQQIKALESCIDDNAMDNHEIDALIIYVDDVRADIEQLHKEQEK